MRYCNLFDPIVLGNMTLKEYALRMKAVGLQRVDKEYDIHLQAWVNNQATATKAQGKKQVPYFKDFKAFFDYEKRINEAKGEKIEKDGHLMDLFRVANK